MKIEDLAFLPAAPGQLQNSQPGKVNFAECLKEALNLAPRAATGLDPPAALSAIGETISSPTGLLEGALSRLETFARGLASQEISLKQLAPLAAVLEPAGLPEQLLCRGEASAIPGLIGCDEFRDACCVELVHAIIRLCQYRRQQH